MESVAHSILRSETAKHFDYLKNSDAAPEFRAQFSDAVDRFIFIAAGNIPPLPPTQTISLEGSVGVLPSPARRIVAQDVLQGNAPAPLKIVHKTIQTGVPERPVELVSIHVIDEVEPATAGSSHEQDTLFALLRCLGSIISRKDIYLKPQQPNEPLVRIAQTRAVFHLIGRGAFGQYSTGRHVLNNPSDVQAALDAYQKSLDFVLPFQESGKPSEDMVAHRIIGPKIVSEVKADAGAAKISIPVIVAPKEYEFLTGYMYDDYDFVSIIKNFYNGEPFILVQSYKSPRLVRYDFQLRKVTDIK